MGRRHHAFSRVWSRIARPVLTGYLPIPVWYFGGTRLCRIPIPVVGALALYARGAGAFCIELEDGQAHSEGACSAHGEGVYVQPGLRNNRVPVKRAYRYEAAPGR